MSPPASARSPREGAVWPLLFAPLKCRRVALAVVHRGRCLPSAGARLRREDPGSALPILDASTRYLFPTWRSLSSLGRTPSVGKGFRRLALQRVRCRLRRGLSSTALGRYHGGTEPGVVRAFRLVVFMHLVALRLIPRRRVSLPDRETDFAGQTKTPDLQEARGARIAQYEGQPTIRQTPGHREIDTARRA